MVWVCARRPIFGGPVKWISGNTSPRGLAECASVGSGRLTLTRLMCNPLGNHRPRVDPSSTADVDGWPPFGIWLGLSQHLVGYGGGVPLAEEQEAEQVHDRVALRPAEVAVRRLIGRIAKVQE